MKRLLTVILAIGLLLVSGCTPTEEDDPYAAIKPSEAGTSEDSKIYDAGLGGDITVKRITTDSREDATELFELIKAYLESQGVTATIKSLHILEVGMAGNWEAVLPVKVLFEDEKVNPVYVVVYQDFRKYTKGMTCMGLFRDSDVINDRYFDKISEVTFGFENNLKKKLGLEDDNIIFNFTVKTTRDLNFSTADKTADMLFNDANSIYQHFIFASWYEVDENAVEINGNPYNQVLLEGVHTFEDMADYMQVVFSERLAENLLMEFYRLYNVDHIYVEYNGELYVTTVGMGGPYNLKTITVTKTAQKGDDIKFVIVETTWANYEYIDDVETEVSEDKVETMFIFVKDENGVWKCDHFEDVIFGWYADSFDTE